MIKQIILSLLFSSQAFALSTKTVLTSSCEQTITEDLIKQASIVLQRPVVKSEVDLEAWSTFNTMNVALTSNVDGAYLVFTAPVTPQNMNNCKLDLQFNASNSCRYSNYGTADMSELIQHEGINGEIKDDSKLSATEKSQILALLEDGTADTTINQLILDTDDQMVVYDLVTLPDGTELDFYSAYRGDTFFGNYFYKNTNQIAGDNSDGSFCIDFPTK